jgi:hypothetical protein
VFHNNITSKVKLSCLGFFVLTLKIGRALVQVSGAAVWRAYFCVILRSKEETVERRVAAVVRSEVLVACSIFEG